MSEAKAAEKVSITVEKKMDKTSSKGVSYVSVVSNKVWYNCWKPEVAARLEEGGTYEAYVEVNGDFRNIIGIIDVALPDSNPADGLDDVVPGATPPEEPAPKSLAVPAFAPAPDAEDRRLRASAMHSAAVILSAREVQVDDSAVVTLKDIHVLADKIFAYIKGGSSG